MTELITQFEIDKIKSNPTEISANSRKIIMPYTLNSGYKIGYSIDVFPNTKFQHISISKEDEKSDPADEEIIITKLLGEGYERMGSFFIKNIVHYRKEMKE